MKKSPLLLPAYQRMMAQLGERLRLARLRRHISSELMAARANISRATLQKIEDGHPAVAMGSYFQVLRILGLEKDFDLLAADDELGRKLQDLQIPRRRRAPKSVTSSPMSS